MKKIYLILGLIFGSMFCVMGDTQYNLIKLNTYDFSSNGGEKTLRGCEDEGYSGPGGPGVFFDNGSVVITDQLAGRSIYLEDKYTWGKIYQYGFYNRIVYPINKNTLLGFRSNGIVLVDKPNGFTEICNISGYSFSIFNEIQSAVYHSNILFIHDMDGQLWSIKNPGKDDSINQQNLLNEKETVKLFKNGDIDGLTIDSEKRLFLNGKLQTLDINTYFRYYNESEFNSSLSSKTELSFYIRSYAVFVGKDKDENTYWYANNGLLVADKSGGIVRDISITKDFYLSGNPTIAPSGDVYFIQYGDDKATLYKIKRQW